MSRIDRLTTLIDRFKLSVAPARAETANLVVYADAVGAPQSALYAAHRLEAPARADRPLFYARVDWSGQNNPLLTALPDTVEIDLTTDPDTIGLVRVMQSELTAQRCGVGSVLSRLGEVLIVRMMRAQIEAGATEPGLLAGLSDPRLSRAIVAMHDTPGRPWRNDDLADLAGMSRSRFADMFQAAVGTTPAAYLRRWRLVLARQDLSNGHRVDTVARRYGFASPEGFSRAFKKHHGIAPISLRQPLNQVNLPTA